VGATTAGNRRPASASEARRARWCVPQVAAAELQMLKTDVRLAEQFRLVICGQEEPVRHGAGRLPADTAVGPRLMTNSMGKAEPASQRVGYPRCSGPAACRAWSRGVSSGRVEIGTGSTRSPF
jgi:hypothetical protein